MDNIKETTETTTATEEEEEMDQTDQINDNLENVEETTEVAKDIIQDEQKISSIDKNVVIDEPEKMDVDAVDEEVVDTTENGALVQTEETVANGNDDVDDTESTATTTSKTSSSSSSTTTTTTTSSTTSTSSSSATEPTKDKKSTEIKRALENEKAQADSTSDDANDEIEATEQPAVVTQKPKLSTDVDCDSSTTNSAATTVAIEPTKTELNEPESTSNQVGEVKKTNETTAAAAAAAADDDDDVDDGDGEVDEGVEKPQNGFKSADNNVIILGDDDSDVEINEQSEVPKNEQNGEKETVAADDKTKKDFVATMPATTTTTTTTGAANLSAFSDSDGAVIINSDSEPEMTSTTTTTNRDKVQQSPTSTTNSNNLTITAVTAAPATTTTTTATNKMEQLRKKMSALQQQNTTTTSKNYTNNKNGKNTNDYVDDDDDDCVVVEDATTMSNANKRNSNVLGDTQPPSKRLRNSNQTNSMPQLNNNPTTTAAATAAAAATTTANNGGTHNTVKLVNISSPNATVAFTNNLMAATQNNEATAATATTSVADLASSMPALLNMPNQSNANLLPGLTDDMYVLEAPSFIVPYIYEKPPQISIKEVCKDIEELFKLSKEDLADAVKVDEFDMMTEQNKEEKPEKKKRRTRGGNDPDESWSEEFEDDDDDDDDDDSDAGVRTKVLIKEVNDDLNAFKGAFKNITTATVAATTTDNAQNNKGGADNYFESPLGKFFMEIALGHVQEYVQTDLIRLQKRKLRKSLDKNITECERAIAALSGNLEASKKKNAPYRFTPKRCEFCNFRSESALAMAMHYETPHMNATMYKCNFCTYEIRNTNEIVYHMEAMHNIKARLIKPVPYHQCPTCGFEDNGKAKLARHLAVCSKKFRPELNLAPPADWEAPAKIPRIKPRHGLVGTATAYQVSLLLFSSKSVHINPLKSLKRTWFLSKSFQISPHGRQVARRFGT